ncbi:MAG: hypothetical protein V7749_12045 [Cocleimonas sp.]
MAILPLVTVAVGTKILAGTGGGNNTVTAEETTQALHPETLQLRIWYLKLPLGRLARV